MVFEDYLQIALNEARLASFHNIKPNPFVGAIVVDASGNIVGKGHHQQLGGPHAEVFAIEQASMKAGIDLAHCTLFVSLEPCSHQGRTPPCTERIFSSGIRRVVVASEDPNPKVKGIEWLRDHDIEVILHPLEAAYEINKVFFVNQRLCRPFVSVKMAASLNGKISDGSGARNWISNRESRAFLHEQVRTAVDGLLSTAHTVIHDDAALNVRLTNGEVKEQNAIVLDRNLDLLKPENQGLKIWYPRAHSTLYLITDQTPDLLPKEKRVQLVKGTFDAVGRLRWDDCLSTLYGLGFCHLLTEAGRGCTNSLLSAQLVDEYLFFLAPTLIFSSEQFSLFDNALLGGETGSTDRWTLKECRTFGDDVFLRYGLTTSSDQMSNL
jgi:diaminohydroxyphosphoribosylaminopyrimidine deaminase/5-amino-6-(5-phosphoribosylamino)uracil reductase